MSDTEELVFTPAAPGNETWLIALWGPTGCGKTNIGAAAGARHRRAERAHRHSRHREQARQVLRAALSFDHAEIREPYRPEKYVTAVERSREKGHAVLIINSMSHEWAGLGGLLDWHEQELRAWQATTTASASA